MIKFLHAADLHLDAPFSALSPEQAAARRQEQRALLTDLAEADVGAAWRVASGTLETEGTIERRPF